MTTLVEEVAKRLINFISLANGADELGIIWSASQASACAGRDILFLIENHPETLERRRKDFEAGWDHALLEGTLNFDDYLAAEKGEE